MMYLRKLAVFSLTLFIGLLNVQAQTIKPPIMGWSSWNHYHINIDESIIKGQADAMVSSGMAAAGYQFINIDDGFFGGRDSITGKLYCHPVKFPSGMRMLSDYIRSKGLTPGIYSDAGANTCGSKYDKDPHGFGVGMYKHIKEDAATFFVDWNFDFIKIDWCGGKWLNLNEQTEYTSIINGIRAVKPEARINVCRWEYPGKWVEKIADSWRISGDIRENFGSIKKIIDLAADTYKYSSPGHYNDLDMLQVGRGMSYDEDKTHFTMWCFMNSPLLAGNDLTKMSKQTIEILTNKEVIALNQDEGFYQGRRLKVDEKSGLEIWEKKLGKDLKGQAIVLYNPTGKEINYTLEANEIGLNKNVVLRDLWAHKDLGKLNQNGNFTIPKHGVVCLKVID
ncbi:alpha-galactosidase [Pelobium manganitolerans]|uniref:Alpha-galactosidase n=1 Tax=Pelobium manganitolerans TaxID=1842495 RepID=A0A419S706_9SPHI|nr:glycoside hydrolase family 27 protein [Pelobium manganitolerans]RKD17132.1 alpha-galactosidase [Pelobium manganitolerans]